MKEVYDPIPDKLNQQPTVWLGLTMGELARMGVVSGVISILFFEMLLISMFGSLASAIFGFLLALMTTVGFVYVGAKLIATRKAGKPYGYSDQKFSITLSKLGLKKIPCVTEGRSWTHKNTTIKSFK